MTPREQRQMRGPSGDDSCESGFVHVVGEMCFEQPVTAADIAALTNLCASCLEAHHVRVIRLCLSHDRRRALVLFRAPDAESVRVACRPFPLGFERVWTCDAIVGGG